MPPPRAAAKSRQTRAIFLAVASEIWFASYTFDAARPPMTHSGFDTLVFGIVCVANRGTGAGLAGDGDSGRGRSSMSGGTFAAPSTSWSALWPQISSLQTGTRGADPPIPIAPIICLLTTTGRPPEFG